MSLELPQLIADSSSNLLAARNQMAFTLGFHIVLASFGVAFPAIMLIAEYRGRKHDDADALLLARRWSKAVAVLFAVGAVTGTVLSFELGLLWPELMDRFGDAFGIGFAIEGLFFFLEAIFIAIYIYGWDRLPGWAHFWSGIPIVISGIGGAASVIAANSWMNTPQGFELGADGRIADVDVSQVLLNPAFGYEFPHMWLAAYMVTGFTVASVYAVGMLRGRRDRYHRVGFLIPFSVAAILTPVQLFVGDIAAREVFDDQPVKFAAFECVYETGDNQPEHIGGICTDDEVKYDISIPGLDSLLAGFSTSTEVQGLEEFPDDEEPPAPTLLHLSFDAMVGIGTALLLLGLGSVRSSGAGGTSRRRRGSCGRPRLRGRRDRRDVVRLDRHRGRPAAVDRPRLPTDRGRGHPRPGALVGLRGDDRPVRRARRAHRDRPPGNVAALARGASGGRGSPLQSARRGPGGGRDEPARRGRRDPLDRDHLLRRLRRRRLRRRDVGPARRAGPAESVALARALSPTAPGPRSTARSPRSGRRTTSG